MLLSVRYDYMSDTIKFATLNFLNKEHGHSERLETLSKFLKKELPDVISFQELIVTKRDEFTKVLTEYGYVGTHADPIIQSDGTVQDNAIYTRLPVVSQGQVLFDDLAIFNHNPVPPIPVALIQVQAGTGTMFFMSAHLAWGTHAEGLRLAQAIRLSETAQRLAEETGSPVILGGDLNATDTSDTVQYLYGKKTVDWKSHLWVDAFISKGNPEEWVTSDPICFYGHLTATTARGQIGDPVLEDFPKRRIDYIMSYGWTYGRAGGFTSCTRFGTEKLGNEYELSDHYGVMAEIRTPMQ